MADNFNIKKFLDQAGVSTLWGEVAKAVKAEADRAKLAEQANAAAAEAAAAAAAKAQKAADDADAKAVAAQGEVDALETYVGQIPSTYTEDNIVAYVQKVATETLAAASGNSTETAASVKQQLDDYKTLNDKAVEAVDTKVNTVTDSVADILADYLKQADKTELKGLIDTNTENIGKNATAIAENLAAIGVNAGEIARIDALLASVIENEDETALNSIKELASWVAEHGEDAAELAEAIRLVGERATKLEGKVNLEDGKTVTGYVAEQIQAAFNTANLAQYATVEQLNTTNGNVTALTNKVNTGDKNGATYVADEISAAFTSANLAQYAKAADLQGVDGRLTTAESKVSTLEGKMSTAEGKISTLEGQMSTAEGKIEVLEGKAHEHANKALLDTYTQTEENLADAVAKKHSHTNKSVLDGITADKVTAWDGALGAAQTYADGKAAEVYAAIQSLSDTEILAAIENAKSNM